MRHSGATKRRVLRRRRRKTPGRTRRRLRFLHERTLPALHTLANQAHTNVRRQVVDREPTGQRCPHGRQETPPLRGRPHPVALSATDVGRLWRRDNGPLPNSSGATNDSAGGRPGGPTPPAPQHRSGRRGPAMPCRKNMIEVRGCGDPADQLGRRVVEVHPPGIHPPVITVRGRRRQATGHPPPAPPPNAIMLFYMALRGPVSRERCRGDGVAPRVREGGDACRFTAAMATPPRQGPRTTATVVVKTPPERRRDDESGGKRRPWARRLRRDNGLGDAGPGSW
jgi:hypothetical protein